MTLRRRIVDWSLTGALILIPALVLRASMASPGSTSALDDALLRITAPLQAGTTWIAEGLGGLWGHYIGLVDVEGENRELRAENDKLRHDLAEATRKAYDVAALEELALVKKRIDADMIGAHVVGAPLTPHFRVLRLRIDRGEHEIREGMAVIAGTGPVGKVQRTFGDYADVTLISDTRESIDVVVKRTGRRGSLIGLGRPDSYACTVRRLELAMQADERAKVGDEIVTSGEKSVFPPGLVVGTVSKLDGDDGLFQKVEVEPAVDIARVRAVMVVLAPPPPADPDAKTRKRSEPAFGTRPL
jgi:rod shape-determining protein MreC